jgi:hypothetical protein
MSDPQSHHESTPGWIITFASPRSGGGNPFMKVFYVGIPDQEEALSAVRRIVGRVTSGSELIAHQPISSSLMAALNVKPGDVVQW